MERVIGACIGGLVALAFYWASGEFATTPGYVFAGAGFILGMVTGCCVGLMSKGP